MLELKRLPNWRSAMFTNLLVYQRAQFIWGETDCCTLGASHLHVVTGCEKFLPFKGGYASAMGAMRVLKNLGYNSLFDLTRSNLPKVDIKRAQVGDFAIKEENFGDGTGYALGIVLGENVAFMGLEGYGHLKRDNASIASAYAVGYTP